MIADAHGGVDHACAAQGLKAQIRQIVGQVFAIHVAPAHHDAHRQSIGDELVDEDIQGFNQFQGLVARQNACGDILFVEGPQCAIQMSRFHKPGILRDHHGQVDEPQQL